MGNSASGYAGIRKITSITLFKINVKYLVYLPKGDIDGSQVGHVFYVDKDIDRIVAYCEKTLLLLLRFFSDLEEKSY
jgi:hypothetical protein